MHNVLNTQKALCGGDFRCHRSRIVMHCFRLLIPNFRERKILQSLVPPRIAGRCGPRGGRLRPPRFILHHFQPGVSRRRGLRIPRFRAGTKAHSPCHSPSPTRNRCAGVRVGMRHKARTPRSKPGGGVPCRPAPKKGTQGRTGGNSGRCVSTVLFVFSLY